MRPWLRGPAGPLSVVLTLGLPTAALLEPGVDVVRRAPDRVLVQLLADVGQLLELIRGRRRSRAAVHGSNGVGDLGVSVREYAEVAADVRRGSLGKPLQEVRVRP